MSLSDSSILHVRYVSALWRSEEDASASDGSSGTTKTVPTL
jgi:hypothetical protein